MVLETTGVAQGTPRWQSLPDRIPIVGVTPQKQVTKGEGAIGEGLYD